MFATQIHLSDETSNQIELNLQKVGETFEQFIQQAVKHELQRREANDLTDIPHPLCRILIIFSTQIATS